MAESVTDDAINLRPIKHSTKKRNEMKKAISIFLQIRIHLVSIFRHTFLEKKTQAPISMVQK